MAVKKITALLCALSLATLSLSRALADDADKIVKSPDGRFAVRVHVDKENSEESAELIDQKTHEVLLQFQTLDYIGDFGKAMPMWSKDSKYVAVFSHDHRTGDTQVIRFDDGKTTTCSIPEQLVPQIEKEFERGRQWHTWVKPARWTKEDELIVTYSGTIRNYKGIPPPKNGEPQLGYEYELRLKFDGSGSGHVESIKQIEFKPYVLEEK